MIVKCIYCGSTHTYKLEVFDTYDRFECLDCDKTWMNIKHIRRQEMITEGARRKYIESQGGVCPFCGGVDIEFIDNYGMWNELTCVECEKSWKETLSVTDIEEIKETK